MLLIIPYNTYLASTNDEMWRKENLLQVSTMAEQNSVREKKH